jgi:hypothetical protein
MSVNAEQSKQTVGTAAIFGAQVKICGSHYPNWGKSTKNAEKDSENARYGGKTVGYSAQIADLSRECTRKGRQAVTQNNQIRGTLAKFGVQ